MSLKSIFHPKLGTHIKFGRLPKRPSQKLPRLERYIVSKAKLPTPPATLNLTGPAMSVLRDVELNNQYGDCVIAAKAHIDAVWTGNAGRLFATASDEVVAQYSAIGGFDPKNPQATDNGCNMQDAISWWSKNPGADGTTILGGVSVDATNKQMIQLAISLFENGFIGMALPDEWLQNLGALSDNTVWDVAGNPDYANGHCVPGVGYDSDGIIFDTWGDLPHLTYAALAKYATDSGGGEFDILISADMLIKGQNIAPSGIDWATLVADANSIFGGTFPIPSSPSPAPVIPPPPPSPSNGLVDPAAVQDALTTAFQGYPHALLDRKQALQMSLEALATVPPGTAAQSVKR